MQRKKLDQASPEASPISRLLNYMICSFILLSKSISVILLLPINKIADKNINTYKINLHFYTVVYFHLYICLKEWVIEGQA